MNLTLLRRAAASAALAAMLSLGLPTSAHALPAPLERLDAELHAVAQSSAGFFGRMLRTLWEGAGIGIDPNGRVTGDNGSILDPDGGIRTNNGSVIDPDGAR
jgi:hypothetical protein